MKGFFGVYNPQKTYPPAALVLAAEPQKNHASTMVRFALDCMSKMNELIHELAGTLGEDTCKPGDDNPMYSSASIEFVVPNQPALLPFSQRSVSGIPGWHALWACYRRSSPRSEGPIPAFCRHSK